VLELSGQAGLIQRPGFELADAFLGDPELLAHFLERQGGVARSESEAADDDLPLALVEPGQDPFDLLLADPLSRFLTDVVGAVVLPDFEQLVIGSGRGACIPRGWCGRSSS